MVPKTKIFVLLGITILFAGGVFLLNQNSEPQPTPNQTPTPSPTPAPLVAVEVPEDWQTYRNEEFGFEVRYPQQYVDAEGRDCEIRQAFDPAYSLANGFFTVTSLEKSPVIALKDFLRMVSEEEKWAEGGEEFSISDLYIKDGIEFITVYSAYQEGRNQHTVAIYVADNSKVLRFWYEAWPSAPCWTGIIEQVIRAVRFVE